MSNVIAAELGLPQPLAGCFRPLAGEIAPVHCSDPASLQEALRSVLLHKPDEDPAGVVFVWTVQHPYPVSASAKSRISYIEKTDKTISQRWRPYIALLASDGGSDPLPPGELDLVRWARESSNWSYYSQLIVRHGPMQVWWASAAKLNAAAGGVQYKPVQWEGHLLRCFHRRHGCLPAKNRRHSGPLLQF
ncbi:hypothetical protein [Ramlibacter sp. AN1133]|uniref:hypothetical protein n=1 Tax=Ramlibacter sp. AN1133 TaxID=3133429 RepID=UPI0030C28AD5